MGLINFKNSGDFWGGLASMLVALPAAVAFGVTVYTAISPQYAALGALAGILGAVALGLVAPALGGTDRLISAPCAPAAALLSAFAIELVTQGVAAPGIILLLTVLGILAGLIQMLIGFLGAGRLIKYIPYTVVSGYMSGVGLIIIGSQIHEFVGISVDTAWWAALLAPELWDMRSRHPARAQADPGRSRHHSWHCRGGAGVFRPRRRRRIDDDSRRQQAGAGRTRGLR